MISPVPTVSSHCLPFSFFSHEGALTHALIPPHYINLQMNREALITYDYDSISKCRSFCAGHTRSVLLWDNSINYVYSSISGLTLLSNNGAKHLPLFVSRWLCLRFASPPFFCQSQPRPLRTPPSVPFPSPGNSLKSLTQTQRAFLQRAIQTSLDNVLWTVQPVLHAISWV